jgi:hypothetical protein
MAIDPRLGGVPGQGMPGQGEFPQVSPMTNELAGTPPAVPPVRRDSAQSAMHAKRGAKNPPPVALTRHTKFHGGK